MDLSFARFDALRAPRSYAALDYAQLMAGIATAQASVRTAQVEARLAAGPMFATRRSDALAALFAPSANWVAALVALHGSFDPALAARAAGPP